MLLCCYIGATLALTRSIYWFQLNERVRPVIINISRVTADICTILSIYFITLMAFSLGIIFVLTTHNYANNAASIGNNTKANNTNITIQYGQSSGQKYGDLLLTLFWAMLDPGPDPDFQTHNLAGKMATILFATYQILVIIIILNLLIAMMNATVQKLQDKKQLYCKFVRTSVWLEFMSDSFILPPPVLIIWIGISWPIIVIAAFGLWLYRMASKKRVVGLNELWNGLVAKEPRKQNSRNLKPCTMNLLNINVEKNMPI